MPVGVAEEALDSPDQIEIARAAAYLRIEPAPVDVVVETWSSHRWQAMEVDFEDMQMAVYTTEKLSAVVEVRHTAGSLVRTAQLLGARPGRD